MTAFGTGRERRVHRGPSRTRRRPGRLLSSAATRVIAPAGSSSTGCVATSTSASAASFASFVRSQSVAPAPRRCSGTPRAARAPASAHPCRRWRRRCAACRRSPRQRRGRGGRPASAPSESAAPTTTVSNMGVAARRRAPAPRRDRGLGHQVRWRRLPVGSGTRRHETGRSVARVTCSRRLGASRWSARRGRSKPRTMTSAPKRRRGLGDAVDQLAVAGAQRRPARPRRRLAGSSAIGSTSDSHAFPSLSARPRSAGRTAPRRPARRPIRATRSKAATAAGEPSIATSMRRNGGRLIQSARPSPRSSVDLAFASSSRPTSTVRQSFPQGYTKMNLKETLSDI